jgi:hypothetical protein
MAVKPHSITIFLVYGSALALSGAGHSAAAPPLAASKRVGADAELILPRNSPLRVARTNQKEGRATFSGRLLVSGRFTYGCTDACEKPFRRADMRLYFLPDARTAASLPRWKGLRPIGSIEIGNSAKFAAIAVSRETMHQLEYGRLEQVTGHASVIVDHYRTGIACDDTWASARFLSFAKPVVLNRAPPGRVAGCE